MYGIIRLLIGLACFGGLFVVVKKCRITRKRLMFVSSAVLSLVIVLALNFWPFEDLFITFDSPQQVCRYRTMGKLDVEFVADGNESTLVVENKNDGHVFTFLPKTEDGWKIGNTGDRKLILQTVSKNISIHVWQYKNDHYIIVSDMNGAALAVADGCDSAFYALENETGVQGETSVTYVAYLSCYDEAYFLIVNGERIELSAAIDP